MPQVVIQVVRSLRFPRDFLLVVRKFAEQGRATTGTGSPEVELEWDDSIASSSSPWSEARIVHRNSVWERVITTTRLWLFCKWKCNKNSGCVFASRSKNVLCLLLFFKLCFNPCVYVENFHFHLCHEHRKKIAVAANALTDTAGAVLFLAVANFLVSLLLTLVVATNKLATGSNWANLSF